MDKAAGRGLFIPNGLLALPFVTAAVGFKQVLRDISALSSFREGLRHQASQTEGELTPVPQSLGACKEDSPSQLSSTWGEACSLPGMGQQLSASSILPTLLTNQSVLDVQSKVDSGVKAFADFLKSSGGIDPALIDAMQASFHNLRGGYKSTLTTQEFESLHLASGTNGGDSYSPVTFDTGNLDDRKANFLDRNQCFQPNGLRPSTK